MDTMGGAAMFASTLMALHRRHKTGKGQFIDLAMGQTTLSAMGEAFMDYAMNGNNQESLSGRDPVAIQGCYRCHGADDWIEITMHNDEEWQGFCRALGNPSWTKDEKFTDFIGRHRNHDELDRHIGAWTLTRNKYDVMHLLQREGVPAGPVLSEKDCFSDPHVAERDFFIEMSQKWSGTHLYPGFPWRYSRIPQTAYLPPVGLGEHNEYVYKELLKMSDQEYEQLKEENYTGDVYMPNVV
jgi:crotonobetainyl-CoA:carnitine CoA-transferase CaiB-like acyl-CoA transferase